MHPSKTKLRTCEAGFRRPSEDFETTLVGTSMKAQRPEEVGNQASRVRCLVSGERRCTPSEPSYIIIK